MNSKRSDSTSRLGTGETFQQNISINRQNYHETKHESNHNSKNLTFRNKFKGKPPHPNNNILKLVNSFRHCPHTSTLELVHFNMASHPHTQTFRHYVWSPHMPEAEVENTKLRQLHDMVQALRRDTRTPIQVYRLQVQQPFSQSQ